MPNKKDDKPTLVSGKKQANKGSFKPGQSGNPDGRKRVPKDIKKAFEAQTMSALNTLVDILNNGRPNEKLKAAEIILDRSLGKATQPISGNMDLGTLVIRWEK